MKKVVLFFIAILFVNNLWGQWEYNTSHSHVSKRFKYGDMYYASNMKGLGTFMADLRVENPDLYQKLLPSYNNIKRKKNAAVSSFVACGAVGTFLLVGGMTFMQKESDFFGSTNPFPEMDNKEPDLAVIGAGMGIFISGAIIAAVLMPKDNDIYNFLNFHNKNNPDKKLDWQIGLNYNRHKDLMLGVRMTF